MSPMFVKMFKKENRCQQCLRGPAPGRKFCGPHLKVAREFWMAFSLAQRAKGRCSYCRRRNVGGGVRCGVHRARNSKTCRAWQAVHGAAHARQQKLRKEEIIVSGFCWCRERSPLKPGCRSCSTCLGIRAATRKGGAVVQRQEKAARLASKRKEALASLLVRYPTLSRLL